MARQNAAVTGSVNGSHPTNSVERSNSKGSRSLSVLAMIDKIFEAIAEAKHNKAHVERFRGTTEDIVKALNGIDVNYIRNAEFYSDLKETLCKIYYHIMEASTRNKWLRYVMAKKDEISREEVQKHVDNLVSRIVFSNAQRIKQKRRSPSPSPSSDGANGSHTNSACCCCDVAMESHE